MLPAINFNDQVFLYADKIDNKGTYRILPLKFSAAQFSITQMTPEKPFGIGQAFSQGPGALIGHCHPSPQPSPLSGERE
jgi:hypothetical protein